MPTLFSKTLIKYFVTPSILFCFVSANAQNQSSPPIILNRIEGIKANKSELITEVMKFDSTMIFKPNPNVDGEPNVIGTDQISGALQVVGEEHKVVLAKWTFAFGDKSTNMAGLTNMGHFAFIIARQPCVNWLIEKIKSLGKDHSRAFTEDSTFADGVIRGNVSYDPTTLTFALSFTPNKEVR